MKIRDCCDLPKEEKIPEVKQKFQSLFPEEIAILLHQRSKIMGYNQALSEISNLDVKLTLDEARVSKIVLDVFHIESREDTQEVIKQVNKYGLTNEGLPNPEEWDNPSAGFFDMINYCKKIAQAIKSKTEEIIIKQ